MRGAVVVVVGRTVVGVVVAGGEVGGGVSGVGATVTGVAVTGAVAPVAGVMAVPDVVACGTATDVEPTATGGGGSTAVAAPVSTTGAEPGRAPDVTSNSTVDGAPLAGDWALRASAATIEAVAARLIPAVMAREAGATVPERRRGVRAPPTRPESVVIVDLVDLVVVVVIVDLVDLVVLALGPAFLLTIVAATGGGRSGDGRRR